VKEAKTTSCQRKHNIVRKQRQQLITYSCNGDSGPFIPFLRYGCTTAAACSHQPNMYSTAFEIMLLLLCGNLEGSFTWKCTHSRSISWQLVGKLQLLAAESTNAERKMLVT